MKLVFRDYADDFVLQYFDACKYLPIVGQEVIFDIDDVDNDDFAPIYEVVAVRFDYPNDTVICFIEASPDNTQKELIENSHSIVKKLSDTVRVFSGETRTQNRRELGETIIAMLPPVFCFDPESFATEIRALYMEVA